MYEEEGDRGVYDDKIFNFHLFCDKKGVKRGGERMIKSKRD